MTTVPSIYHFSKDNRRWLGKSNKALPLMLLGEKLGQNPVCFMEALPVNTMTTDVQPLD